MDNLKISPLGLVEKKTPGEYRLIHHLSYPRGSDSSVNANIPKEFSSVSYAGIDDAISLVKTVGRRSFMTNTSCAVSLSSPGKYYGPLSSRVHMAGEILL